MKFFLCLLIALTLLFSEKALALISLNAEGQRIDMLLPPFFDSDDIFDQVHPDMGESAAMEAERMLTIAHRRFSHCIDSPLRYLENYPRCYYFNNEWDNNWIEDFFCRNAWWEDETPFAEFNKYSIKRYSQYSQKMEYLYYWVDKCFEAIIKKAYDDVQEMVQEVASGDPDKQYLKSQIELRSKGVEYTKKQKSECFEFLNQGFEKVIQELEYSYKLLLWFTPSEEISDEMRAAAHYERGKINFDRGETLGFIEDISKLIEMEHTQNPQVILDLGKAYIDANQYNQAIKILSEAIKKNPSYKDAYFERATAYFEIGNFNLALADYITSEKRPTALKSSDMRYFSHIKFAEGIAFGCLKGGIEGGLDFIPSLLSSAYGLGKGLWIFASDPVGVSQEMAESCHACIEFIKDNISREFLAQIVPELRECIEKWEQLNEEDKGRYIGYVIGRYGVDVLAGLGCARGIQIYRNVKRANAAMTLEAASLSPVNLKTLAKESEEYFKTREAFKKRCKLHRGQQEKHIPGANNFQPGKSELTVSCDRLEKLASSRLGEGIPSRSTFGEMNYREFVEFGEIIGVHVEEYTQARTLTSIGEIHYNKNGGFHVVPVHPSKFKG